MGMSLLSFAGDLVSADTFNNRIRLAGVTTSTVAGDGGFGYGTNTLSLPAGVASLNGMTYFADTGNGLLRATALGPAANVEPLPYVRLEPAPTGFSAILGSTSRSQAITLKNTGAVGLTVSSVTASGDFSASGNCNAAGFARFNPGRVHSLGTGSAGRAAYGS